jgi:hypothetical protein
LRANPELRLRQTVTVLSLGNIFATVQLPERARRVALSDIYQCGTVAFGEGPASVYIGDLVIENRRTLTFVDLPED